MNLHILILILSFLFIVQNSHAAAECGKDKAQNTNYTFCIYPAERSQNANVLYYLHGLGHDEKHWLESRAYQALRRRWEEQNIPFPTVITISFGKLWVLTEIERRDNLLGKITTIVMPKLEKKIGGMGNGHRLLLGESMGGLNSAQLYLKHPEMFSKVALLCPAIATIGPFATRDEISQYILRTGADATYVGRLLLMSRNEFKTPEEWQTHNPLELIRKPNPQAPELYVSCGDNDEYGFYEGAEQFYDDGLFSLRRAKWQPIPNGTHCAYNLKTLSDFLTSESSKAFLSSDPFQ